RPPRKRRKASPPCLIDIATLFSTTSLGNSAPLALDGGSGRPCRGLSSRLSRRLLPVDLFHQPVQLTPGFCFGRSLDGRGPGRRWHRARLALPRADARIPPVVTARHCEIRC